ncbi:restriction endonuclease subunit S [Tetragenococcus halophilus]|uniref:restriction endonuclease subunit S n=1 Tax=Tetragenococcus halophilus TaxID=51669 RepID=UPI001B70A857|nr:restriction endonuclease subunit S [Tetragenococcus halophilus]GFK22363.1 type I restriction-modification system specificity subunit S [Tetragenococcus halophilus]
MKAIPTWKQRKLGESLSILKDGTHGTHKNVENGPHLLSAKNIKNGKIKVTEDDRKISQKEYEQIHKNFQLKSGDILLTIVGSIGEAAVLQDPTGITFQRSVAYLRSSEIDTYFLYTLFIGPDFQKELKNRQVVSAQPGIYLGDISKIIVKIPKGMKEQKQIGKFFKQLNNAIALHQEKITKLQALKKAALQSLLPEKSETEPKVRFANFSSSWKQRKLGEITKSYSGGTPSIRQKEYYNGTIPFIRSAEINSESTELYISENGLNNSSAKIVEIGDILYALYGATSGEVGISKIHGAINQAILAILPKDGYNSQFIMQWLYSQKQQIIHTYLQGGQGNLSSSIVRELQLKLPLKNEQLKVAVFFKNVDRFITLHQIKLQNLQTLKKSFLQKMFI